MAVPSTQATSGIFARRLFAVAALLVAALAMWYLRHLLLLVFAAILFAVALRGIASIVTRGTRVGDGPAFVVAAATSALLITLFFTVLGTQLLNQLAQLWEQLPQLLSPIEGWLGIGDVGEWLAERAEVMISEANLMSRIAGFSGWAAALLGNLVLVAVAGLYVGYRPGLYVGGLLLLFPSTVRGRAAETLDVLGAALRRWLLGQIVSMLMVGMLTFAGLWALGIESALALGFIAGMLEFVPFVGPVLAAIPALAIALAVDTTTALWVLLLYVAIQQLEGNVINPLIQQRAVSLPPALTLFGLLAFGVVFGPLGVLLATPLTVVCLFLVKKLWVHDALGEPLGMPGADEVREQRLADEGSRGKEPAP